MNEQNNVEVIALADAAKALGVTRQYLDQLARAGKLVTFEGYKTVPARVMPLAEYRKLKKTVGTRKGRLPKK